MTQSTNEQTNETSMSGNYETANTANDRMFTEETSEFGMRVFSDPSTQATYNQFEDEYKKKYALKRAYDNQEFLRKMRADIRREYLTRKKQVKHLQKDAAIDFRNAEMSLQEHYISAQAKPFRIRAIDINAPLVSLLTLPTGDLLDLKTFHAESEFNRVCELHDSLSRQWLEEDQRSRDWQAECAKVSWYHQAHLLQQEQPEQPEQPEQQEEYQSPSFDNDDDIYLSRKSKFPPCWDSKCALCDSSRDATTRSAFGGCYDYPQEEPLQEEEGEQQQEENSDNKWNLPMTADEKQILEIGEQAQRTLDEFPQCFWTRIATHDPIDHAGWVLADVKARHATAGTTDEQCAYETNHTTSYSDDEEAMEIPDCPPITHDDEFASMGSSAIATVKAKKPANNKNNNKKKSAASATKARIAKQQQQQQQQQQGKKFVPIHVTVNDNRSSHSHDQETMAMLSASKIEINLPKKNLQNASREAKKRHDEKWKRINADQKHSNARGTRIANLPPRPWEWCKYMNDSDFE